MVLLSNDKYSYTPAEDTEPPQNLCSLQHVILRSKTLRNTDCGAKAYVSGPFSQQESSLISQESNVRGEVRTKFGQLAGLKSMGNLVPSFPSFCLSLPSLQEPLHASLLHPPGSLGIALLGSEGGVHIPPFCFKTHRLQPCG